MIVSFSCELDRENHPTGNRYADLNVAIGPARKDFPAEVGITRRSA
jgi:hypothetical protein